MEWVRGWNNGLSFGAQDDSSHPSGSWNNPKSRASCDRGIRDDRYQSLADTRALLDWHSSSRNGCGSAVSSDSKRQGRLVGLLQRKTSTHLLDDSSSFGLLSAQVSQIRMVVINV